MKKYLVIGNPIEHSLSPLIHNFWMKKYKLIDSIYEKKKVEKENLKSVVDQIRDGEIKGANVTVPFKKEIIPLLDRFDNIAQNTNSVNTLLKVNKEVWGYNTDSPGFKSSLNDNLDKKCKNKDIFIVGAGGVASSILHNFLHETNNIYITNRSKEKAQELKKLAEQSLAGNKKIEVINWGEKPGVCDMVINTTSVGLKKDEKINIEFNDCNKDKNKLFYDLIYNPRETSFLKEARLRGNMTMNGQMMFLYQAAYAFNIWTNIEPKIDNEVIKLLD